MRRTPPGAPAWRFPVLCPLIIGPRTDVLMRRLVVSDGIHFHFVLSNDKPKITELLEEKKEAVKNYIANVEIICKEHPKDKSKWLLFIQSLEVLKEDAEKIGSPSKYEPEAIAKATVVASPQTEQPVNGNVLATEGSFPACCWVVPHALCLRSLLTPRAGDLVSGEHDERVNAADCSQV